MLDGIWGDNLVLTEALFAQFQALIYDSCGISLADSKRTMLSVRLAKRLRALNLSTFEAYYNYIKQDENLGDEFQDFLNVVTTNKTDFYREKHHFEILVDDVVPQLRAEKKLSTSIPLRIWSAGCSSGEEPYTIAMELADLMGAQTGNFEILATDISTKVLREAMDGVYDEQCIDPIPESIKQKYLLRGTGKLAGLYKIAPEIRKHIKFGRLNFTTADYKIPQRMHIIFCRNVLIYFDTETRHSILQKLCKQLTSKGYLFIGHSETIVPQEYKLERLSPTVYRKLH